MSRRQTVAEEPADRQGASVSSASSPSRISEISARVKPSTRRLASSRLRSDSETRGGVVDHAEGDDAGEQQVDEDLRFMFAAIVSRKLCRTARLNPAPATAGVRLQRRRQLRLLRAGR